MTSTIFAKTGLETLLTPDNCVLMLIDHQPFQAAAVKNIDVGTMINNTVSLAKTAKAFGVPTLLTSVLRDRGGLIFKQITDVFPEQTPIDRTFINTWEDENCVSWVQKTGRKKIVIAARWTEVCLAFPVIHALGDGYEVYFVTDASGGTSVEAHEMGIARMIQAGAVPLTSGVWLNCSVIGPEPTALQKLPRSSSTTVVQLAPALLGSCNCLPDRITHRSPCGR